MRCFPPPPPLRYTMQKTTDSQREPIPVSLHERGKPVSYDALDILYCRSKMKQAEGLFTSWGNTSGGSKGAPPPPPPP